MSAFSSILPVSFSKLGVSILNETTGETIFAKFLTMEVRIILSSELMRHTREDGSTFIDAKIVQPFEVEITGFVDSVSTLKKVSDILMDRSHYYSVSANGIPWSNLMASDVAVDSDAETMSAYPVQMVFKQILVRQIEYTEMDQDSDYSNRRSGDSGMNNTSMTVQQLFDAIKRMI